MAESIPSEEITIVTRGVQKKVEKSIVVTIRQGTSKKEVFDLLRAYQLKNYHVSDIRVSNLRSLDNSLPQVLDITFVQCDIGNFPSIVELPILRPLATSTPLRPGENLSLNWSRHPSSVEGSHSNLGFDTRSFTFSSEDIVRDIQFEDFDRTFNFSLRDFQPLRLFEAQGLPAITHLDVPLPSDDDSFKSANPDSILQESNSSATVNISVPAPVTMATDTFKAKFKMSPPIFGGSYKEDVKDWVDKFERAARINNWVKDEEKARYLPCFLSGSANIWYENLEHAGGSDLTKYDTVLKGALIKAFDVTKIHDALEYELRNRRQQPDEEVSHYYYDVIKLCRRVNPNMANEAITRHLMFGLNEKLVPLVIMQSNATPEAFLANAIKAERAQIYAPGNNTEMAKLSKQMEDLACTLTPKVNEIKAVDSQANGDKQVSSYPAKHVKDIVCFYCNKKNHMQRECFLWLRDEKGRNSRGSSNSRGGFNSRGGQNRYYYSKNGGNNGFQGATYDRDFPPMGNQYDKFKGNRGNYSQPQQQQKPFLPSHVRNYNRNNNRGEHHNVNMMDAHTDSHVVCDRLSHDDNVSKNE